jgi:hypothetical protein
MPSPLQDVTDPAPPLRFADVLEEIRGIAALAATAEPTGSAVVGACARAEALLIRLRRQFMQDVVLGSERPTASSTSRT